MTNNYLIKGSVILLVLLNLTQVNSKLFAQSIGKEFTQRISSQAQGDFKNKKIYNLKGDFTMIGNANAFVDPYSDDGKNNSYMKFNKLLKDPANIVNSSSADFVLPTGIDMACTKIIYAGLYWCGRTDELADVLVKDENLGNGLNKKKIKLKVPGAAAYVDVTAAATDIYYGADNVNYMYTGYSDITDLVKNAGLGTYAVGNIATFEGAEKTTGYYAGWGMVIIYENKKLPWRDISVFDGFSFINKGNQTLSISGFNAAQNGDVKIRMGMMAAEGDRATSGDYFKIQQLNTSNWISLYHSLNMDKNPNPANTSTNFFNSSILTGGNSRNPNYLNNYGIDIAMFDLPNSNNALIANGQKSTQFQYGTGGDVYSIFNITFAIDAYVPAVEALNISINNIDNKTQVNPDQELEFEVDLYNKGSEAIKDAAIEIILAPNVNFVSADVVLGGGTATWVHPTDFTTYPGGKIIWNKGNILLPTDPNSIIGKLKYKVKVTNNCALLITSVSNCAKTIALPGKISGTGAISSVAFESKLIIGHSDGVCEGNSIEEPFTMYINVDNTFTASCPKLNEDGAKLIKVCAGEILRNYVMDDYPLGTLFYSQVPGSPNYEASIVTGNFLTDQSGKIKKFYAIVPGIDIGCYLRLETLYGGCVMMSNPMIQSRFLKSN
ncbi:DUF11 domain-containing protein [Pedobacter nototheniae]|uniref:DUF11 domain-containing protein n=1 Tax=Pedobacter nototheniae TaxID=2488994 RepID=UPI00103F35B6|nr:DUF11 domain-containing protein [Pedobacter nototheniae]